MFGSPLESERTGGVLGVQGRKGRITQATREGRLSRLSILLKQFLILGEARFFSALVESGQADRQADKTAAKKKSWITESIGYRRTYKHWTFSFEHSAIHMDREGYIIIYIAILMT